MHKGYPQQMYKQLDQYQTAYLIMATKREGILNALPVLGWEHISGYKCPGGWLTHDSSIAESTAKRHGLTIKVTGGTNENV